MRHTTPFLGLLVLAPLVSLAAQEMPPLLAGMRVRVTTSEIRRIGQAPQRFVEIRRTGTLIALKAGTLVLREKEKSAPQAIPLPHVKRLEVRVKLASHGKGALEGAGAGALVGAEGAAEVLSGPTSEGDGIMLLFLPAALLFGGGVGALAGGERWEQVPLPVRVGVAPQRGVRLAASFRF